MFSVECVNAVREHELSVIESNFDPEARILEIGGGNGVQAKLISEHGFNIVSIDIPQTGYLADRVFPIVEYDGTNIPFADGSFDIVFSSNVLEHILDLDHMQREIRRVLRDGGYCVHAMPTATWRWWTTMTSYIEMCERIVTLLPSVVPRRISRYEVARIIQAIVQIGKLFFVYSVPPRHGEFGNAFTELVTFSRFWWKRQFHRCGFRLEKVLPMGLFYTGHTILALKLPLSKREMLSNWLGSSCMLYVARVADADIKTER